MNWKSLMERFNREVISIENEAKHFIDESFKNLRSSEGAFDMLLNFKHIRSREAINSQMMKKFNEILHQYGKEVSIYLCGLKSQLEILGKMLQSRQSKNYFVFK